MRDLKNIPNITPVSSDYPHGAIRNESEGVIGTAVIEELYGDIVANNFAALDAAGITLNNLKDNVTNGYQLLRAYERLFSEPVGQMSWRCDYVIPDGYLRCEGNRLLCADYPDLWTAIGNRYTPESERDGIYFRIPDSRNKFTRHSNDMWGGSDIDSITLSGVNLPSHSHEMKFALCTVTTGLPPYQALLKPGTETLYDTYTEYTGGNPPASFNVDTVPQFIGLYLFIKAKYRF